VLTQFAWDVKKLDEKLTCCALVDWLARWSRIQEWRVFLAAMQRAFPAIPPLLGSRNVPYNADLRRILFGWSVHARPSAGVT